MADTCKSLKWKVTSDKNIQTHVHDCLEVTSRSLRNFPDIEKKYSRYTNLYYFAASDT